MPQEILSERFNALNLKGDLPKFVQRGVIHKRNPSNNRRIEEHKKGGNLGSQDLTSRQ